MGIQVAPDMQEFRAANDVIKGIASVAPPQRLISSQLIDPLAGSTSETCDRDYTKLCPEDFVSIGAVHGGSDEYCFASPRYAGPCASESYAFGKYTGASKARWSRMCQTNWPCTRCQRDSQKHAQCHGSVWVRLCSACRLLPIW